MNLTTQPFDVRFLRYVVIQTDRQTHIHTFSLQYCAPVVGGSDKIIADRQTDRQTDRQILITASDDIITLLLDCVDLGSAVIA